MASVRTARSGSHVVRAYAGIDPATGRAVYLSETVPADAPESAVEEAMARLDKRAKDAKASPEALTVGSAVKFYLDGREDAGMSPTTLSSYRSYLRRHIAPAVGSIPFGSACAADFSKMFRHLMRPKASGGAGLALSTVARIRAMLSGCFETLLLDGVTDRDPMAGVKVPAGKRIEAAPLMPVDLSVLKAHIASVLADGEAEWDAYMMACVWAAALGTGCRRGELSGFSVSDLKRAVYGEDTAWSLRVSHSVAEVDGALVVKEPKSATSRRNIALDDRTFSALSDMLARRSALLGPPAPSAPLFVDAMGERIAPSRLSRAFSALCKRLHLAKGVHLHTLRHTHATYLLEAGESIRAVQERLGHSSVKTTLELYGHVLPGRDLEAARLFARATEEARAMPWEETGESHGY